MKLYILDNKNNDLFDYSSKLSQYESILIKNCNNLKLSINVITKITIINSYNIYIHVNKIITSIEVTNSDYNFINGDSIPCIEMYKSTLYLLGDIIKYKDCVIISELSNLLNININIK